MFNLSFYKKKLKKILLPINKIIESFFTQLNRSKSQSYKQTSIKKRIVSLDNRIENFFDKFKNFNKFNQNRKKSYNLSSKTGVLISIIVLTFFSYFFIPAFYNKNEIKKLLVDQTLETYDINIRFNEKIKYGLFPKPFFYTKNLNIIFEEEIFGKTGYTKFYISFNNFFSYKKLKIKNLVFQKTEFNANSSNLNFFNKILKNLKIHNEVVFKKNRLFFRDQNQDLLFLSKIKKINFFYDSKNQLQKAKSKLEIFNVPFKLSVSRDANNKKKLIKVSSRKIRLNTETSIEHNDKDMIGYLDILFFNKKNSFQYKIKNDALNFLSKDKNFSGLLNFKPFYFSSNLNFDYVSQKKIFNNESLILDFLNTDLLYNPNLNAVFDININKIEKFEYFKDFNSRIAFGDGRIKVNNFYTKLNLYEFFNIPTVRQGGKWNNGYCEHEGDWFIFCNIQIEGKGYYGQSFDYLNYIDPDGNLNWEAKRGSKIFWNSVQKISKSNPYIFVKETEHTNNWRYIGQGFCLKMKDCSPVQILWEVKRENIKKSAVSETNFTNNDPFYDIVVEHKTNPFMAFINFKKIVLKKNPKTRRKIIQKQFDELIAETN